MGNRLKPVHLVSKEGVDTPSFLIKEDTLKIYDQENIVLKVAVFPCILLGALHIGSAKKGFIDLSDFCLTNLNNL